MKYSIIVSKGNFKTVKDAAYGEKTISWSDFSSDDCRACTECFAATDAKNVLEAKKNFDIEVYDLSTLPSEEGRVIFIGEKCAKFAAEKYSLDFKEVTGEETFRMYGTKKDNLNIVLIYGDNRKATAYGIIEYMNYHGIRFISPDEYSTCYVKELDKSREEEFDIIETPSFKSRESYSEFMYDTSEDFLIWAFRNRINKYFIKKIENPEILHKYCFTTTGGGHEIWYHYMDVNHEYPYKHKIFGGEGKPEDPYEVSPLYKGDVNGDGILTYGEAHPEWYAEIDGVRRLFRDYELFNRLAYPTGDFLCTTNEDSTGEFIKLIVESLISGENKDCTNFKLFGLDNGKWCDCEKCRVHKTYSYRLLMFAYKLDKAIKKATEEGKIKRKITIEIPAYHETLPAPDEPLPEDFDYSRIYVAFYVIERCYNHNINDEKCLEANKRLYDLLMSWTTGNYKGEITVGEYYNVSSFAALPFIFIERMKNDIPFYHSIGACHLTYLHMLARKHGMQALNNFLYTHLMWNKDADVDALVDEYLLARYGEDASKMKEFYLELEDAGKNCKYFKHYQWSADENTTRALSRCLGEGDQHFFPLKHAKLDYREDDYQAGPSLKEMKERYEAVFNEFAEMIKGKDNPALIEDYEQLEYAVCTLNYLYYRTLSIMNEDDKESYDKTLVYKEKLLGISNPLLGYDLGDRYKNGFSALAMHEQKSKK